MRNVIYLIIGCVVASCSTIPDQSYHKIKCLDRYRCSESELDTYIKAQSLNNIVIVNGWSGVNEKNLKRHKGNVYVSPKFQQFYLEYDEMGHKIENNRQLDLIKRAIDIAEKPIYLIIFIHGWHNNASIDINNPSLDTTGFPYMLARRAYAKGDMDVIGVYIGWRGEKYKNNPAKLLSIKNRALIADAIGKEGELRDDLISLTQSVNNKPTSGHSLLIGHSLGGRLLSRAFLEDLSKIENINDWSLGKNSLLVTLNAAIGADAFDKIFDNMSSADQPIQRPLWINLTSKDDKATSLYFPYARLIGINLVDSPTSGKYTTVGHYMPYLSHEVTVIHGFDKKAECGFINPEEILNRNNTSWFELPKRENSSCATRYLYQYKNFNVSDGHYYTTVLRKLDENPEKPLGYMWNFRVDSSVIDFSKEESRVNKGSGAHNAFVQTNLGRMLDDMLFTQPLK